MKKILIILLFIGANICSAQRFTLDSWSFKKGDECTFYGIYFVNNLAKFHDSTYFELNRIKDFLLKYDTLKVEIQAHVDYEPPEAFDNNLSRDRAQAIVDYLVKNGVDKKRLYAQGYGDSKPITIERGEGRSKNRRVVVLIL